MPIHKGAIRLKTLKWLLMVPLSVAVALGALLACGLVVNPVLRALMTSIRGHPVGNKDVLAFLLPIDIAVASFVFVAMNVAAVPSRKLLTAMIAVSVCAGTAALMFGVGSMQPYVTGGGPTFLWSPFVGALTGGSATLLGNSEVVRTK